MRIAVLGARIVLGTIFFVFGLLKSARTRAFSLGTTKVFDRAIRLQSLRR